MIFWELKVLELQAYNLGLTENWRLWYNVGIMDETEKAFVLICDGIKTDCDISHTAWKMLWVEL